METAQSNALVVQIQQNNLSPDMAELLTKSFLPFQQQADEWMDKAKSIQVTDISQTKEMKDARDARLALKDVRVAVEKKRKELKDESLRTGKAIDGVANVLKSMIEPIEAHLQEQEDFAKVQEAKRVAALQVERMKMLAPYLTDLSPDQLYAMSVGGMPQTQFDAMLNGYRIAQENKIAEAKRIEDERIAKEKSDADAREAQRAENERLKAEADAREKAFAEERAKAKAEQDRIEAEAKKQREAAEKEANRIKAEAAAQLKKEQQERESVEREIRRLKDIETKRIADQKAEEERVRKEQAAAEKKAAKAPDKQKIIAFAQTIRNIETPETKSEEAQEILNEGSAMIMKAVKFLMEKANSL